MTPDAAPAGLAARIHAGLTADRHRLGASLLRVALGAIVLYQLLGHWADRGRLWGPHGFLPAWLFARDLGAHGGPSWFATGSDVAFEALCVAAVLVAILYTVGWQTRWTGVWLYVAIWSLVKRNPFFLSGGDTLMLVMLPFLLLLDTAAYLSVDSGWRRPAAPAPPLSPVAALLHNIGLGCVFAQLAVFYGFAGLYKLLGATWPDGTAVYYTLRLPEFERAAAPLLYGSPALVALLTWATLAFELGTPWLLWSRRTRWLVTLQAVAFHGFIAGFMGLAVFAAQALAFQLVLHDDAAYRAAGRRCAALARRRQSPESARSSAVAAAATTSRVAGASSRDST